MNEEGVVCVIYNVRVQDEFSIKQCDICKKYCDGFVSLTHGYDKTLQLIGEFFDGSYETYEYDFPLEYTKKKFISRCLSSSYAPLPDSSNYEPYVREITDLIGTTFKDDIFEITNKTVMFVGRMRKVTPYANTAFDELNVAGLSPEQRERKIAGFIYNLERLTGMAEGSLQEAILAIFRGSRLGSDGNEAII